LLSSFSSVENLCVEKTSDINFEHPATPIIAAQPFPDGIRTHRTSSANFKCSSIAAYPKAPGLFPAPHCSLLVARCFSFPLIARHSLLIAFLLIARYSLLFSRHSLLKIRNVSSYIILLGPIATISMCCFSGLMR
jgi:hypothetical protein